MTSSHSEGVLLFEIFTQAQRPFNNINANVTVIARIVAMQEKDHQLLPKPAEVPAATYDGLMCLCWTKNPARRPSFADLAKTISSMLDQQFHTSPPPPMRPQPLKARQAPASHRHTMWGPEPEDDGGKSNSIRNGGGEPGSNPITTNSAGDSGTGSAGDSGTGTSFDAPGADFGGPTDTMKSEASVVSGASFGSGYMGGFEPGLGLDPAGFEPNAFYAYPNQFSSETGSASKASTASADYSQHYQLLSAGNSNAIEDAGSDEEFAAGVGGGGHVGGRNGGTAGSFEFGDPYATSGSSAAAAARTAPGQQSTAVGVALVDAYRHRGGTSSSQSSTVQLYAVPPGQSGYEGGPQLSPFRHSQGTDPTATAYQKRATASSLHVVESVTGTRGSYAAINRGNGQPLGGGNEYDVILPSTTHLSHLL